MAGHKRFVVVYKDHAEKQVIEEHMKDIEAQGGKINHRYETVFKGFAANIPQNHLSTLSDHPDIESVEEDSVISID